MRKVLLLFSVITEFVNDKDALQHSLSDSKHHTLSHCSIMPLRKDKE